jgi:hypothetical protein
MIMIESIVVVAIAVLVIFIAIKALGADKAKKESLIRQGFKMVDFVELGQYISGHPKISKPFCARGYLKDEELLIFSWVNGRLASMGDPVGQIQSSVIKNIVIEDSSTIERRVSFGRVLLVGIFALAWKKRKKNELAYLVIEWNDGRFDHETMFQFEGKDAMTQANTARNKLIAKIS